MVAIGAGKTTRPAASAQALATAVSLPGDSGDQGGRKRAEMAGAVEAERATGYVVGGISPLGQRRALPAVIDRSALTLPRLFVSAGRRGLEIALRPADLIALCHATTAAIARG